MIAQSLVQLIFLYHVPLDNAIAAEVLQIMHYVIIVII